MKMRWRRTLWLMSAGAPLALFGCGGTGAGTAAPDQGSPPAQNQVTTAPSSKPDTAQQERTPTSGIDAKKAVDVLKGEVTGGEATAGPTPVDLLYQAPRWPVSDEALNVDVPQGLDDLVGHIPPSNPMTKGKYELGKQLYFDPRVSKDGTISCATCHNPDRAWTDQMPVSIGIGAQTGSRSAPTVLNTVYGKSMFWDGRAPSLEGQAQGPIQNKIEMGDQSYQAIVMRLRGIPGYVVQFKKVFGTDVTLDGIVKAIATFERTALSGGSAYDRYIGGMGVEPDLKALSDSQKRGMVLFGLSIDNPDDRFKTDVVRKKANCTSCHAGFNFTDEQFHNLGIGWDDAKKELKDLGRWVISPIGAKNESERGAFKTPTLRDSEKTAPYMHDGSLKTLEAVVEHYNKGGNPNPYLDKDMPKLNLTDQEKQDVVAFLKALTGKERKVTLPVLPPGSDGKTVDPTLALIPPGVKAALSDPHARLR
jgi:cytochrome c peroxidase